MINDNEQISKLVNQVARSIGRNYYSFTSIPDVEQELWLLLLEKQKYVEQYLEHPEGMGAINVMLYRRAREYCEEQRASTLGVDVDDFSLYSPAVIRTLLQDVFSYEDWQSLAVKYDASPKSKSIEATSDRLSMLVDVKHAVEKLPERDYNIIVAAFKYSYTDEQLADMLGIATSSVKTTVKRSVNRIAKSLNDPDPSAQYIGGRHSISNAHARAIQANQYDGG